MAPSLSADFRTMISVCHAMEASSVVFDQSNTGRLGAITLVGKRYEFMYVFFYTEAKPEEFLCIFV